MMIFISGVKTIITNPQDVHMKHRHRSTQ